jgi:hypothetical protein
VLSPLAQGTTVGYNENNYVVPNMKEDSISLDVPCFLFVKMFNCCQNRQSYKNHDTPNIKQSELALVVMPVTSISEGNQFGSQLDSNYSD